MSPIHSKKNSFNKTIVNAVSNTWNFVSHPKTLIATALVVGNLVTFGLGNVSNAFAQTAQVPQEALLMMEFPSDTSLKSVIQNIKKELPSRNLNDISITSIGSQLDFEGQNQTFSKANEDSLNAQQFADRYQRSQVAFLKTLVTFKEADEKNQDYESKEAIKPLMNKYSKDVFNKTLKKYQVKSPLISSITFSGSLANLTALKGKVVAKSSNLIDLIDMQNQAKSIKIKADKEVTQDGKVKTANEEIQKLFSKEVDKNPELKNQINDQTDLSGITPNQIKAIDDNVKTDINGNKYISNNEIKLAVSTLNLEQVKNVQKAIANFNNTSTESKDGSLQSIQNVKETSTIKKAEISQDSTIEKLIDAVGSFGSVKANAQWCSRYGYTNWYWWGTQTYANSCLINDIKNGYASLGTIISVLSASPCSWACAIIGAAMIVYSGWLDWSNTGCGNQGAYTDQTYLSYKNVKATWVQNVC
jgi:hypothetical protein